MSETHHDLALRSRTVAGAAAGNLTVTGIRVGDVIKAVQRVDIAAANIASQFTVTADDTINNTGGTSTATGIVLVIWIAHDPRGGSLTRG